MAVFFNQTPIDMLDPLDWSDFFAAVASDTHSASSWSGTNAATGGFWQFTGVAFHDYQGNVPFEGTIHSITYSVSGVTLFSVSGVSVDVGTFLTSSFLGDLQTAVAGLYAGNESVTGSTGDDSLWGFLGDDALNGAGGDDFLQGGSGADTLLGGAGADYLDGGFGPGANIMSAGANDDGIISYVSGDDINGGSGEDFLYLERSTSNASFNFGTSGMLASTTLQDGTKISNVERFEIYLGNGNDTFTVVGAPIGENRFDGGGGSDRLVLDLSSVPTRVAMGFSLPERGFISATGWSLNFDKIEAFTITTGAGNDELGGGELNDILSGGGGDDFLDGKEGADTLAGGAGNDGLVGGAGDDSIDGGTGDDSLIGYDGNNTLLGGDGDDYINSTGLDVVDGGAGTDMLAIDLSAATTDLVISTTAMASSSGVTLANGATVKSVEAFYITAGSGDDTFFVSGPIFQVQNYSIAFDGGEGDDRFVGDFSTFSTAVSMGIGGLTVGGVSTGVYVERLEITSGSATDELIGGNGDDVLNGGDGADRLNGGAGHNILIGGAGTDNFTSVYGIDDIDGGADADGVELNFGASPVGVTIDMAGAATDVGVTLSNGTRIRNVETFEIRCGDGDDTILVGANSLVGDANRFLGFGGTDRVIADLSGTSAGVTLDNGYLTTASGTLEVLTAEIIQITGGSGNDFFSGESNTQYILFGGAGDDFVFGDSAADQIRGGDGIDLVAGGDGDDMLSGGAGADVVQGGNGADMALYDDSSSSVTVNLLTGAASGGDAAGDTFDSIENVTGSVFADTLIGTAEANVFSGGLGDDTLVGDALGDVLSGGGGSDTASYETALAGVTANLATPASNTGDASGDTYDSIENLSGSAFADTLIGDGGANIIVGKGGADAMSGGGGSDLVSYVGSNAAVTVDLVTNSVTGGHAAGDTITGFEGAVGSAFNDTLTGSSAANSLFGGEGSDTLVGANGDDELTGGAGGDILNGGSGNDAAGYSDALAAVVVNLSSIASNTGDAAGDTFISIESLIGSAFNDTLTGSSASNIIDGGVGADAMTGYGGNDVYVVDNAGDVVTEGSAAGGTDRVESRVSFTLGTNLENLTLKGTGAINATGNTLANILLGNGGANILDGKEGADAMSGYAGDDVYIVDDAGDVVTEGSASGGVDRVEVRFNYTLGANVENLTLKGTTAINATGNALANALIGNGGANILDGGTGADNMSGYAGNDVYLVDNAGDVVTEGSSSGGVDLVEARVSFTLGANVENLTLKGTSSINATGNTLANILIGNGGANILDGKGGADAMTGYAGNDVYIVNSAGDVVIEGSSAGGVDRVESSVSFTLGANFENLTLTGSGAINATGNTLANTLIGNSGANVLDGKDGADKLTGGAGDDVYIVDNAGDVVTEASSGGADRIESFINFTLGANFENLMLRGTDDLSGQGNAVANLIVGNTGDNVMNGLSGADTLTGGVGDDVFQFTTALSPSNIDTITDFVHGEDLLHLENSVFTALGANGVLAATAFHTGAAAADAADRIIYNSATGALLYDADGNGIGAAVQFATLGTGLGLTNTDIFVI